MQESISVVVPAFNEEGNILALYRRLAATLKRMPLKGFEIIFVDDGSTDSTFDRIRQLSKRDKRVKAIRFSRNFGQTFAWDAGIRQAKGKYIVTIDADLQNYPEDIPVLYEKLQQGFDVVSGWRIKRKDPASKRFFSFFANALRKALTGETIHDSGCSLKIYKRECFEGLHLYEGVRRFITAVLSMNGYEVAEVKVRHQRRKAGKTKYGASRLLFGFLELLTVVFLARYGSKPLRPFGALGIAALAAAALVGIYLAVQKIFFNQGMANIPLLILGALLVVLGVQFIALGMIAETVIRTKDSPSYTVRERLG